MKPVHSSAESGSRMAIILSRSPRTRSIISFCDRLCSVMACSPARSCMPARPYADGAAAPLRATSKAAKYPSVVSTRWPTMSLTFQLSQAVGESHASGFSAIAKSRSASLRTTRRMVSLPSYDVASHSVTAAHPSLGDLYGRLAGAGGPGWTREPDAGKMPPPWRPHTKLSARRRRLSMLSFALRQFVRPAQLRDPETELPHRVGRAHADQRGAVAHRDQLPDRLVSAERRRGQRADRAADRVEFTGVGLRAD